MQKGVVFPQLKFCCCCSRSARYFLSSLVTPTFHVAAPRQPRQARLAPRGCSALLFREGAGGRSSSKLVPCPWGTFVLCCFKLVGSPALSLAAPSLPGRTRTHLAGRLPAAPPPCRRRAGSRPRTRSPSRPCTRCCSPRARRRRPGACSRSSTLLRTPAPRSCTPCGEQNQALSGRTRRAQGSARDGELGCASGAGVRVTAPSPAAVPHCCCGHGGLAAGVTLPQRRF